MKEQEAEKKLDQAFEAYVTAVNNNEDAEATLLVNAVWRLTSW